MNWLDARLRSELDQREQSHLLRRVRVCSRGAIDLGSNDYLGLARDERVLDGARRALEECGGGARASRLLGGDHAPVKRLEEGLAALKDPTGHARALVFSSGYAANLGVVTALVRTGDRLLCDKRNHASLIDACRLAQTSRASVRFYSGQEKLKALLKSSLGAEDNVSWIVSDTIYSMDGDIAEVPILLDLAREYGAGLVLDDAHGTGTLGLRGGGALEFFGVAWPREVPLVVVGTLSKALASQGGFAVASAPVIEWLVNASRSFIYSTGIAPAACGAALAALQVLATEPERLQFLHARSRELSLELETLGFEAPWRRTPIVPIVAREPERALAWSSFLEERGVWCPAVRPPTVPRESSRLRASLHAAMSDDDMGRAVAAFQSLRARSCF